MEEKLFIGLDFGSDSVRAVLVDSNGRERASSVSKYRRWSEGKYSDAAQCQFRHHPLDYLESMEFVLTEVLKGQPRNCVAGIGVDATMSTPCAVDRDGVPLALHDEFADDPDAMFVLWKDHTALTEAERINQVARDWKKGPDYLMYCGGIYSSEWFWSKVLHVLRHSSTVRKAAFSWVELCDWIPAVLTGHSSPLTMARGRCSAGHKAMWNAQWSGLPSEEFLTAIDPLLSGLRERLYSETSTMDKVAGTLSRKWSEKLGLPETVTVAVGGGDAHVGTIGAGIEPGKMVMVVGTSACHMLVAPSVSKCIRGICGQVDGSIVPGLTGLEAGQASFGDVFAWFKRLLEWSRPVSLADLEREAVAIRPGESGTLALDWFNGRRTPFADEQCRGAFCGLNLGTTAPMMYRSLVDGVSFGTRAIVDRFAEEGIAIERVVALGGIAQKSPLVMQTLADVLNRPIGIIAGGETCGLGGAIFASVAAGAFPDVPTAMKSMAANIETTYVPDPSNVVVYDTLYQKYLDFGKRLYQ
ncbi:MAG: ribulokinase [Victivallales bacterium]|nr:ribulokinase [Victivallales bacterium]